ncbi:MAG: hypothetical protein NVSMB62_20760 [Acidobacteriaceae bacterium]
MERVTWDMKPRMKTRNISSVGITQKECLSKGNTAVSHGGFDVLLKSHCANRFVRSQDQAGLEWS